jgi:murein DD-endopeptidase MepM/ murein hydrolase activator NlpD
MARRAGRRVLALRMAVLLALGTGGLTAVAGTASAQVTSLVGGATDFVAEVSLFGGPSMPRGPAGTPGCDPNQPVPGVFGTRTEACNISVILPAPGGSESVSDPDGSAVVRYGPGIIFSRGPATVRTEGTTGAGGSVTSTAEIQTVNATGREVFTAASLSSTCTASESGVTGSTTISGGRLQTSEGNPDLPGDEVWVDLPTNPTADETYPGRVETVGDTFEYRFNEQIPNADGSLTVYAAHLALTGPTAVGHIYIGRVDCGVDPSRTTTSLGGTTTTRPAPGTTTTRPGEPPGSGRYGAPEWWPLRGTHLVGCTNANGCGGDYHGYSALDIDAERGDEIYAAGAGEVTLAVGDQGGSCDTSVYPDERSCPDGSRGNRVVIEHDASGAVTTRYLHLTTVVVEAGDLVDQNTLLGTAGDSGWAGHVHLHFEQRARQANGSILDVDPVPLKACHGDQLKSYPQELGKTSWSEVTAYRYLVRSDGTACAGGRPAPPVPALAPGPDPTQPAVVAATGPTVVAARSPLSRTGTAPGRWTLVAGVLVVWGALFVVCSRRRVRGRGWHSS